MHREELAGRVCMPGKDNQRCRVWNLSSQLPPGGSLPLRPACLLFTDFPRKWGWSEDGVSWLVRSQNRAALMEIFRSGSKVWGGERLAPVFLSGE